MNAIPVRKTIYTVAITAILSLFLNTIRHNEPVYALNDAESSPDMLAYVSEENYLLLYDPRDRTEVTLLDDKIRTFAMSPDGRVAFTRLDENDTGLYYFDPQTRNVAPIYISQSPATIVYPLAWSPDGRYLAFASYEDLDDQLLYVWAGENVTNIMPDNGLDTAHNFSIEWSYDGRLAFTNGHGWSSVDIPPEIYLWDGNTTTNLNQNPDGWDSSASWSKNGQLLFGSSREDESGIYVWDGVSFRDGSPDVDTFIQVDPELHVTNATWTDDGFIRITVILESPTTRTKLIVLWDVEREAIIRKIPITSDYAYSWLSHDGQVIFSSQLASGLPSYYLDVENTEGQILFSTHTGESLWSSSGYLAYCAWDRKGWFLSIWDGHEAWKVARSSYKPVRWQNGSDIMSCNNG